MTGAFTAALFAVAAAHSVAGAAAVATPRFDERAPHSTRAVHTAPSRRAAAPDNDLSSLDPEFRARLDRVITRMTSEMGHSVAIVETYREQSRQESLFAQGRFAPGPVVTWTRNSLHTLGRAADIVVDGATGECAGYRDLRRLAEAEGLHTLGARDPGHVEMRRTSSTRFAWVAPSRALAPTTLVAGAVMTRIIATGHGDAGAAAAPTVFSRQRPSRGETVEQADGAVQESAVAGRESAGAIAATSAPASAPASALPGAPATLPSAMPLGDGERRRVPNAAERRGAAAVAGNALRVSSNAGGRADDRSAVLDAVRADARHRELPVGH